MLDFNGLCQFSRDHCLAICAFLVPANIIATLQTLIFVFLRRSPLQMFAMTSMAIAYALAMIFHVFTWFIVGVVMAPTFILLGLGGVCVAINFLAIYIQTRHRNNAIVIQQLSIAK